MYSPRHIFLLTDFSVIPPVAGFLKLCVHVCVCVCASIGEQDTCEQLHSYN